VFLFLVIVSTATAQYSGGTGEPNDPYQIATAADLIALGETPEDYDKQFILTADIDLDPNLPGHKVFDRAVIPPHTNDATMWFEGTPFTGVFDGNGYTISHLTISGEDYLGLFGRMESGSQIRDLGVLDVSITGSGSYIGAIVGSNGHMAGDDNDSDGGVITSCYSTGAVSGRNWAGGLVGFNGGGIVASYSSGSVIGNGYDVGGLVGSNSGSIATSYSTGSVSGEREVGGLVGSNWGSIAASYSTGLVSGQSYVGGLVGQGSATHVTSSFWDIQTSGQATSAGGTGKTTAEMQTATTFLDAGWDFLDEVGNGTCDYWQMSPSGYPDLRYSGGNRPFMPEGLGTAEQPYLIRDAQDLGHVWLEPSAHYRLVQSVDLSGITWSMAVVPCFGGTFEGDGYVISNLRIQGAGNLGLFGELRSGAEVYNVALEAVDVNGTGDSVGGLASSSYGGSIIGSYTSGCVNGNSSVGGLVGRIYYGRITTSCSEGSVSGGSGVGGLVGRTTHGEITYSYSACTVVGSESVGGLVGLNKQPYPRLPYHIAGGPILDCYSIGAVSGTSGVGGLVGSGGNMVRCYSTGLVSGESDVGGLLGHIFFFRVFVTDCFWDTETSGQATSAGGTGKTTAEMQTAATFLEAGWDFVGETGNGTEDIWWILEGHGYPRLWWEAAEE